MLLPVHDRVGQLSYFLRLHCSRNILPVFFLTIPRISILVFIPILERVVYPIMRRAGFELRPMQRITIGFVLASLSLAYAAIVQHLIYSAGPCYMEPLKCDAVANIDHPGENLTPYKHLAVFSLTFDSPEPRAHRRPDPSVRLHRRLGDLHLRHRSGVRLHQSTSDHEVLRTVAVPPHERLRLRSQRGSRAGARRPEDPMDVHRRFLLLLLHGDCLLGHLSP